MHQVACKGCESHYVVYHPIVTKERPLQMLFQDKDMQLCKLWLPNYNQSCALCQEFNLDCLSRPLPVMLENNQVCGSCPPKSTFILLLEQSHYSHQSPQLFSLLFLNDDVNFGPCPLFLKKNTPIFGQPPFQASGCSPTYTQFCKQMFILLDFITKFCE